VVPAGVDAVVWLCDKKIEDKAAQTADVDKAGRFVFKGVGAGTYSLEVYADGYITGKTTTPITVAKNSVSGNHIIQLTRGAVLKGKIAPTGVDPNIEIKGDEVRCSAYYDSDTGFYKTDEGLPSGEYRITATAKGYAPIDKTIKLTAPNTAILDITFVRTGSISGKISPAPLEGGIIAKNGHEPVKDAQIQRDGSYKIENLPAGTYDLVIMAKGYERVVGFGPVPGPDTLTDQEKKDIEATFAKSDKAWKDKDVDTVVAMLPPNEKSSDAQEKKSFGMLFNMLVSFSATRHIDFMVGQTGKSAVVVERVHRKMVLKQGDKEVTRDELAHAHVFFAFQSGNWQITETYTSDPRDYTKGFKDEDDVPCNVFTDIDYGHAIVAPMKGEPGYSLEYNPETFKPMPWRYSGDARIVSIKVESGAESRGHDFTLTPLAKP